MEISRWGFDKISRISDRYRHLRDFLADVLEGERTLIKDQKGKEQPAPAFEIASDVERIEWSTRLTGVRAADRPVVVFKALAPFFEAGFCLREAETNELTLESMFLFGRVFLPPAKEAPVVDLPLPALESGTVFRGRSSAVLRVFKLEGLAQLHQASTFAFSPEKGIVYLLVCGRPHPWQLTAIEKAHLAVTNMIHPGARL